MRQRNKGLPTLGGALREQGYEPLYVYGGYAYFDNMRDFFGGNGYTVVDRTAIESGPIHHETIWGVADEDLFALTLREIDARATRGAQGIRRRLQQDAQARALRLEQLDRSVAIAAQELASAQSAQADGQAIGEGDRQGRRISAAYWQRQQRLAETVARARMRLEALSTQSAALR